MDEGSGRANKRGLSRDIHIVGLIAPVLPEVGEKAAETEALRARIIQGEQQVALALALAGDRHRTAALAGERLRRRDALAGDSLVDIEKITGDFLVPLKKNRNAPCAGKVKWSSTALL